MFELGFSETQLYILFFVEALAEFLMIIRHQKRIEETAAEKQRKIASTNCIFSAAFSKKPKTILTITRIIFYILVAYPFICYLNGAKYDEDNPASWCVLIFVALSFFVLFMFVKPDCRVRNAYLLLTPEELIAQNPGQRLCMVNLDTIQSVMVLEETLYNTGIAMHKIIIRAKNIEHECSYEIYGVENAFYVKSVIEQKVAEAKAK